MKLPKQTDNANSIWTRLFTLLHDDTSLTDATWRTVQPCKEYRLFDHNILITQPSSSFWVYLLGILTTLVGVYFWTTDGAELSRTLWGVSLMLWGVGALVAGTSYQAFGYHLKCRGRPKVVWTSWWEVIYLILQQLSVNVMLVAVAYSCLPEKGITVSVVVAWLVSIIYTLMVFYGAFKPVKSLITFELMVHFCTPIIVFFIGLNSWRYFQYGEMLDLALLGTWLGLILTMWLYWQYYYSGYSHQLWAKGRWLTENDVLHVALLIWMIYIGLVLAPLVKDL